jgi:hypothetical protein
MGFGKSDDIAWVRNGAFNYVMFPPNGMKGRGEYLMTRGSYLNVGIVLDVQVGGPDSTPLDMIFPTGNWQRVGSEKIKGVLTEKYKVSDIKNQNKNVSGTYWINPQTGIPVRFELVPAEGRRNMSYCYDLVSFEARPQAESLFRPPTSYKRVYLK